MHALRHHHCDCPFNSDDKGNEKIIINASLGGCDAMLYTRWQHSPQPSHTLQSRGACICVFRSGKNMAESCVCVCGCGREYWVMRTRSSLRNSLYIYVRLPLNATTCVCMNWFSMFRFLLDRATHGVKRLLCCARSSTPKEPERTNKKLPSSFYTYLFGFFFP